LPRLGEAGAVSAVRLAREGTTLLGSRSSSKRFADEASTKLLRSRTCGGNELADARLGTVHDSIAFGRYNQAADVIDRNCLGCGRYEGRKVAINMKNGPAFDRDRLKLACAEQSVNYVANP
jgi:hypothetical protein